MQAVVNLGAWAIDIRMTSRDKIDVDKLSISLVVITLNEEQNIERCIRSAPFVDDIVVVDSFSTDRTVEIARDLGARVFSEKWQGFRAQKTMATQLAKNDWVLSLDADEALSPEAQAEIIAKFKSGLNADGFEFPRQSYHMGRWIRFGGWFPDRQLRFFNRKKAEWRAGNLHERVFAEKVLPLSEKILHWPFANLADQVATNNRYSGLGAKDLHEQGRKFHYWQLLLKPISKFLETYIVKLGFCDGFPGFVIAVGAAYSVFLKFSKLRELEMGLSQKEH